MSKVSRKIAYLFISQSSDVTLVSLLRGDFMHTLHSLRCLPLRSRGCGGLAIQFCIGDQRLILSKYDTMALSYAAHDLAAFPAFSDHITGAGAYFAACDAPGCVLCMIDIRIAGVISCGSSSLSRFWVLVDAT